MGNTALQPSPDALPARSGPYHGVQTVLDFGDLAGELAALRNQCGVVTMPWRIKILVTGKDRARWLHNMVSNNVRDLSPNRGVYSFVLNAQGRILGDIYIYNHGESFLLDIDQGNAEPLMTAMKRYIIMDKVEMNVDSNVRSVGVCGPKAIEVLAAAGFDAAGMEALELREQKPASPEGPLVRGPENKPYWYEIWSSGSGESSLLEKLAAVGAKPIGAGALELWRILQGIPQYGQDIRDRDLPQETGQTQALCFTKGCYIGQEIVERIRSRGQVHRKFTGFEFPGETPAPGKYESEGRVTAEVTSVAHIPTAEGEKRVGLGYVRRETADTGPQMNLGEQSARIVDLPFKI
jgi:folate-binding protein YgfZ